MEAKPGIERILMGKIPLKRSRTPEGIAGRPVHQAPDKVSYITGAMFFLGAGMLRQGGNY